MKRLALGLAAACFAGGIAAAQTSTPGSGAPAPGAPAPGAPTGASTGTTGTGTKTGTFGLPRQNGQAAAAGDNNQAIATTNANASQPAHGSNSFTAAQARGKIQDKGFANVTDLKKDDGGVWRGKAQKNGQTVNVWLDYKGNVGQ